jgi:ribosomal protein S18 acetylase RimI-like enzyme
MLKIYPIETNKDIDIKKNRELFEEYADFLNELIGKHSQSWADHHDQKILKEAKELPGEYAAPKGCILFAKYKDEIAGCIAISEIETDLCELKRLYIRPDFRRKGIGTKLCKTLIEQAKSSAYTCLQLHTAIEPPKNLYKSLGFTEIAPTENIPLETVVFMELKLT